MAGRAISGARMGTQAAGGVLSGRRRIRSSQEPHRSPGAPASAGERKVLTPEGEARPAISPASRARHGWLAWQGFPGLLVRLDRVRRRQPLQVGSSVERGRCPARRD